MLSFSRKKIAIAGRLAASTLTGLLLVGALPASAAEQQQQPRGQGQWDLSDLYLNEVAWNDAYAKLQKSIEGFSCDAKTLTASAEQLAHCLNAISAIKKDFSRLSVYASLSADQDLANAKAQERDAQAKQLGARLGQRFGFIDPTLLKLPKSTLQQWAGDPALKVHRRYLQQLLARAEHTLSAESESALAAFGPVLEGSETSYSILANAELPWPKLRIGQREVTLDQAGYAQWRGDPDADVRKRVFDTFWPVWQKYTGTLGSLLSNRVSAQVTDARLRHYGSAREAALAQNEIPMAVYDALIDGANRHLPTLYRYLDLRRRQLGLSTLRYSDLYADTTGASKKFSLAEAKQLLHDASAPLGEDYVKRIDKVNASLWSSPYPAPGKRSGAYMNGSAYDVHPYVLLNFNGDYQSVSTYAHEWGHGIHSILATENQPFETADYPIFLAEVASTTNEELLLEHMLQVDKTRQAQLFYLGQALDNLRSTFFRQAQFAEFEAAIHAAAERGEALSGERLTKLYGETLAKYYGVGKGVTEIDPAYYAEWAFVPHFYYDFYVYQYATSVTAAHYFASRIAAGDQQVRDAYLNVLKQGAAKPPYQLLRDAGVDLASDQPYDDLAAYMEKIMDRIEALLKEGEQPEEGS